jgi:hypothetical protein
MSRIVLDLSGCPLQAAHGYANSKVNEAIVYPVLLRLESAHVPAGNGDCVDHLLLHGIYEKGFPVALGLPDGYECILGGAARSLYCAVGLEVPSSLRIPLMATTW